MELTETGAVYVDVHANVCIHICQYAEVCVCICRCICIYVCAAWHGVFYVYAMCDSHFHPVPNVSWSFCCASLRSRRSAAHSLFLSWVRLHKSQQVLHLGSVCCGPAGAHVSFAACTPNHTRTLQLCANVLKNGTEPLPEGLLWLGCIQQFQKETFEGAPGDWAGVWIVSVV